MNYKSNKEIYNNFKIKYGVNPYEFFLNKNNYNNLNNNDYEVIKEELINLRPDVVCELYIIKLLYDFLISNSQYFLPRGPLSNSFILFKLGITNVDLYRYKLPKEVLYGLNNDKIFNVDINIAPEFKDKIISFIKDTFKDDLYYKMIKDKDGNLKMLEDTKFLINLSNEMNYNILINNGNKYIEEDYDKLKETHNFVSLNIILLDSLNAFNELRTKYGTPNYNILNDKNIINEFFINHWVGGVDLSILQSKFQFDDAMFNGCDPLLTLARIVSACHSTNVLMNAKDRGTGWNYIDTLKYPFSRDEVMMRCLNWIYDKEEAYDVMEYVRRGFIYRTKNDERLNKWQNIKSKLIDAFDEDYADYLDKVEYMFSLGCALEYAVYYFNLMYYKVYFYEDFFIIRTKNYQDYLKLDELSLFDAKESFKNNKDFESACIMDLLIEENNIIK